MKLTSITAALILAYAATATAAPVPQGGERMGLALARDTAGSMDMYEPVGFSRDIPEMFGKDGE